MESPETSPSWQLMKHLWPGAMAVQAVHVAAALGLADLVADTPKSADDLARATGAHPASLLRLLRSLASLGIFAEDPPGCFRHTPLGEALRSGQPQSMRGWAVLLGAPLFWRPMGALGETVATGRPSFDRIYGEPFFNYLSAHPEEAAIFNAAMNTGMDIPLILAAYDFSRFRRIVDVGGGQGKLLEALLAANPEAHGVLFDLPGVVAGADGLRSGPLASRAEVVGGDFFEAIPEGGDAYVLKGVIHDWDDESALKILTNCRRAIRPKGTLVLLDTVLTPANDPMHAFTDLLMMVLLRGRERTEAEFEALLRQAGFALTRVIPTAGHAVIEASPAQG